MQVKCISCGASQNVTQSQNCEFCGNIVELESAKNNYDTFLKGESGNLMTMAETAIEATNWEEALQFFNQVLTKDISNSDAWLGKGIAIVYTSKIGDLKINEAIAYWKNALKHAPNAEAMGKRVAKEINAVVNAFYPSLENHFIKFKDLDNSYQELVSKFVTLESALDYAVQLDPTNILYSKTGYQLCKRVIAIPKSHASADYGGAIAGAIIGGLQGNKYTQRDAISKGRKASELKDQVNRAAQLVYPLEEKYINNITKLDPSENLLSSNQINNSNDIVIKKGISNEDYNEIIKLSTEIKLLGFFSMKKGELRVKRDRIFKKYNLSLMETGSLIRIVEKNI
jgi:hypothetical protein